MVERFICDFVYHQDHRIEMTEVKSPTDGKPMSGWRGPSSSSTWTPATLQTCCTFEPETPYSRAGRPTVMWWGRGNTAPTTPGGLRFAANCHKISD